MFHDLPRFEPDQTGRQRECQLAAFGFAEETGSQPSADRVQFQFRNLSFQSEQQPPIDRRWIVNSIAISDQAIGTATQIEQLIPVRTVPRQPRCIVRDQDADFTKRDLSDQFLKASASLGRRGRLPEIQRR